MCHIRHLISRRSTRALFGAAVLLIGGVAPDPAAAQRPFRVHDPFYRGETARRSFFDGYAFTTEISYRTSGALQDGQQTFAQDPFGLSFRLDYQVNPSIDVGAILDASGSNMGRTLGVSWLTFKYYQTEENTDYAFRLAVDPALDGRVGAPQVDIAFLSTTLLSPNVSSDYALGARRVRVGYEQWVSRDYAEDPNFPEQSPRAADIINTLALGWELHAMTQYSVLLNPARNNVFVSGLVYMGKYDILETSLSGSADTVAAMAMSEGATADYVERTMAEPKQDRDEWLGGAIWIRSGVEYNRPSFQVMPFFNFALKRWGGADAERSPRLSVGLRFMLR